MKLRYVIVLVLTAAVAAAQDQRTITGSVLNSNGEPLVGATILVQGTTNGTVADLDGSYSIRVNEVDQALLFSFTGYSTQTIPIETSSIIHAVLIESASTLEEIVVIGYGTRTRSTITGSVGLLEAEKLEQVPVSSFEQTLQGNVAGLQSTGIDGSPGGNAQIRIRGIGSITASSEPLYVIDGQIVQSGDLTEINGNDERSGNVMAGINPNDIESLTVLKDASSTAVYGSRGANGVILITTKSGKAGVSRVNLRTQVGFNSVASNNLLQPLNADQYTQLFLEGYTNGGDTQAEAQEKLDNRFEQLVDPSTGQRTNTNWLDAITRTGLNQSYDLSASGGTEKMNYFFSGSYFDQESHLIGSDFDRLSGRINLGFDASEAVRITNRINISNTNQNGFVDGSAWANPLYNAYLLSPLIPIRDDQGRFNADHKNYFPMGGNNPVGKLSGEDTRQTKQLRLMDNFAVEVDLLQHLTVRSQWNFDVIQIDESQFENARFGNGRNSGGLAEERAVLNKSWLATQSVTYDNTFGSDHTINVFVGYETQESTRKIIGGYGEGFPNDKLQTLNSAASAFEVTGSRTKFAFVSYISRLSYVYRGRYYVDASLRRDGSSRFGSDKRWGNFYSIGAAWTLSDEPFMQDLGAFNYLKLRGSYGTTGNADIGNFPSKGLYAYGRDYDGEPGGEPNQIANPILTWESQQNFNIGLDFVLYKRFSGTIDYFNRRSSDLILDVPISFTTGYEDLTQNFGELENKGLELALSYDFIDNRDATLTIGLNTTILKNKLTKFGEPFTDGTKRREEGRDYQSYFLYGWAGVDQSNGDPTFYVDETQTEITNDPRDAERYFVGKSATPDHFGGMNVLATYKGLTLSAQLSYSWGNYIYEAQGRFIHGDGRLTPRSTTVWGFENRWVPGKTDALLPMHEWGDRKRGQTANSTRYLWDGSYLRLRNVTLSYDLGNDLTSTVGLRSCRVYVRGVNLLTMTKEKDLFLDPEQAINGIANSLTPAIKNISVGIDFGF